MVQNAVSQVVGKTRLNAPQENMRCVDGVMLVIKSVLDCRVVLLNQHTVKHLPRDVDGLCFQRRAPHKIMSHDNAERGHQRLFRGFFEFYLIPPVGILCLARDYVLELILKYISVHFFLFEYVKAFAYAMFDNIVRDIWDHKAHRAQFVLVEHVDCGPGHARERDGLKSVRSLERCNAFNC
eukprot:2583755-Rhodomonas_salina.1